MSLIQRLKSTPTIISQFSRVKNSEHLRVPWGWNLDVGSSVVFLEVLGENLFTGSWSIAGKFISCHWRPEVAMPLLSVTWRLCSASRGCLNFSAKGPFLSRKQLNPSYNGKPTGPCCGSSFSASLVLKWENAQSLRLWEGSLTLLGWFTKFFCFSGRLISNLF